MRSCLFNSLCVVTSRLDTFPRSRSNQSLANAFLLGGGIVLLLSPLRRVEFFLKTSARGAGPALGRGFVYTKISRYLLRVRPRARSVRFLWRRCSAERSGLLVYTMTRVADVGNLDGRHNPQGQVLIPTAVPAWELGTTERLVKATNAGWKAIDVRIKRKGRNDQDILCLIVRDPEADQEELYHEDPTSGILVAGRPRRELTVVADGPDCKRQFISYRLERHDGACSETITVMAKKLWVDQEGVPHALAYHPQYDNDMTFVRDPRNGGWRPTQRFATAPTVAKL